MTKQFLDDVYQKRSPDETWKLYQEWSSTYDDEMDTNGYATPARCADALSGIVEDLAAPLLDFGCGTGRSGVEFAKAGFQTIDGCDISEAMVAHANSRKVYRRLMALDPEGALPFSLGDYSNIAAVGVISLGGAPVSVMDDLIGLLEPGGTLTFSYNDHTMQSHEYTSRVSEYVDTSTVDLLFKEHGDHLPGIGMQSTVFILRKR